MKILLGAPYVGEIGWELLAWQGVVRRVFRQGRFDRLIVLGAPGKEGFYADMPGEYIPVDLAEMPGCAYEDRRWLEASCEPVAAETIRNIVQARVRDTAQSFIERGHLVEEIWPPYDGRFQAGDANHQTFIRYQPSHHEPLPEPTVVLIQRNRGHGQARNWPQESWTELENLLRFRGVHLRVYPNEARAAIDLLGSADLAIGQSTGGMHLAGLCGCPRVVWGLEDYLWTRWEFTNRQRYETIWNPLGTPTVYHAVKRQPEPSMVAAWVMETLGKVGRRTGSTMQHIAWRSRWHAHTCVARHIMRSHVLRSFPWPVQRWVRYGLL